MLQLSTESMQPKLSDELLKSLRDGLATCTSQRGLSPEAQRAIATICNFARENAWTPEQLVILVKEACHTSPEVSNLNTTAEREVLLASVISACIQEFYNPRAD